MNRRSILLGTAALGSGAALLAGVNAAHAQDTTPIPIGAALPMSGASAADGIEFEGTALGVGYELTVDGDAGFVEWGAP